MIDIKGLNIKNDIKKQIAGLLFNNKRNHKVNSTNKLLDISSAKSALLFNCESVDDIIEVEKFVSKIKQTINIGGVIIYANFNYEKTNNINSDIIIITINDFSFFGNVNSSNDSWLKSNSFDLLLSLSNNHDVYYNALILSILTSFKAGIYNEGNSDLFDFTIKCNSDNLNHQLEQFIYYFNKLQITI